VPPLERYSAICGDELYRRLATGGPIVVLDVRTPTEFQQRHIPGSLLIPLQDLDSRLAELPQRGIPVAVVSEQGVRGVSACRLLAEYGYTKLHNLDDGLDAWPGPLTSGATGNGEYRRGITPSSFLVEHFDLLPRGLALDLAMGEGRNAIYLATRGFDVDGVDADPQAVARARVAARKLGAPIRAMVGSIEDGTYIVPIESYHVITVFNYLHRPMFRDIKDGVIPGGVVIYQAFFDGPGGAVTPVRSSAMLEPDELKQVFADWEVLRYREIVGPSRGNTPARAISSIVARRPS
jgi:rhodanese-related sulfurtransferase